jgi:hypothetical protein
MTDVSIERQLVDGYIIAFAHDIEACRRRTSI